MVNDIATKQYALNSQRDDPCANRFKFVEAILEKTRHVLQKRKHDIIRLIDESRPHIKRIQVAIEKEAPYFNVFDALGVTRKEVIQSRFIAYLLSPNKHHNQKTKFLNAFLSKIDGPIINVDEFQKVLVNTEHFAGDELGRMDIVIRYNPDWIIVIENKIDAGEGETQLSRYNQWLARQTRYKNRLLVFLTPTGQKSVTGESGSYIPLSYVDLADTFFQSLDKETPESVRAVINQFISACHSIGGINMATIDRELQELLTQTEDNIRAALVIEQQAVLARKQFAKDFVKIISQMLNSKISALQEISKTWRAISRTDSDGPAHVEILTLGHDLTPNYRLVGEYIFTHGGKGRCGWYRPSWVDLNQPQETASLTRKMKLDGCSSGVEGWWIESNDLRGGNQGYVLSENDEIIACLRDYRSVDHPLAKEIADEMWEMFEAYRADIEALESFKQLNEAASPT